MNDIFRTIVRLCWGLLRSNNYKRTGSLFCLFIFISCAVEKDDEMPASQFSGLSFGTENTIEILTWNLENFPKADEQTVEYVAQILTHLNCDIVALQEISSGSYFNVLVNRCNQLDEGNEWVGVKTSSGSYGLAYIYKANRINVEDIFEIFEQENIAFPREPFIIDCDINGSSFVLINNHLKCCGDGTIDSIDTNIDGTPDIPNENDDEARRQSASFFLEEYILNNYSESNVIVVGDLNDDIHEPRLSNVFWNFIENSEHFKFVDMQLALNGENEQHWTYWSYPSWPSHIDHILVNKKLFDEFEGNASTVTTIKLEDYFPNGWSDYDEFISDHRPVAWKFSF